MSSRPKESPLKPPKFAPKKISPKCCYYSYCASQKFSSLCCFSVVVFTKFSNLISARRGIFPHKKCDRRFVKQMAVKEIAVSDAARVKARFSVIATLYSQPAVLPLLFWNIANVCQLKGSQHSLTTTEFVQKKAERSAQS